jgi:hypothetical protein
MKQWCLQGAARREAASRSNHMVGIWNNWETNGFEMITSAQTKNTPSFHRRFADTSPTLHRRITEHKFDIVSLK